MKIQRLPEAGSLTRRHVFVHVGKCGGTSILRAAARSTRVAIDEVVHIRKPPIDPAARYYIAVRAPIERAISAFNWRYEKVVATGVQRERYPGEAAILAHYGTLDRLATALYREDGTDDPLAQGNFRSIHHLGESIAFYLEDLLASIAPQQIGGVLAQERLDQDIARVFGVRAGPRLHEHRSATPPEQRSLSQRARYHLQRFLGRDFACLATLNRWGALPDETYARMMRSDAGEEA